MLECDCVVISRGWSSSIGCCHMITVQFWKNRDLVGLFGRFHMKIH